ncbi:MAG: ABC transporter substrate-binding protein [Promethearchaeota archaeon]
MKTKLIVIIGVFMFLITPFFGLVSFAKAQTTENSLIYGAINATPKSWDPATSQADLMGYIKSAAVETLIWQDTSGDYHPLLAESWTIHERPEGVSATGPNQGGVAAVEFKLQEGVTFHDGSAFNASVAKWNIDRTIQITGYDNLQWNNVHWMNPAAYKSRFIPTWDLSWAINDPEISFIDTAAWADIDDGDYISYTSRSGVDAGETNDYYIWFDLTGDGSADPAPSGKTAIYVNISATATQEDVSDALGAAIGAVTEISASNTADNVTITNSVDGDVTDIADFNSGLTVSTTADGIIRNTFKTVNPEFIPIVNSTIVVSEYVLNVTLNKWYQDMSLFGWYGMISQEAYGPWFNTSIPGYESVPNAPDGTPFPGHMIGTGPYKFESVDFVVEAKVHSTKFENYWNRTALEAVGAFSVTDFYGRFYADATSRGNALLATDIDLVNSMLQDPAPIADVKASPYLTYIPTVPDASVNVVSMLSAEAINIPLASLGGQTIKEWFPTSTFCIDTLGLDSGTPYPDGLNKTVRKALSYAYDYNGFVSAVYPETSGGGIYCWSPWGMSSPFTDEGGVSHPGPDPDFTAARTILLADPYYASLAAARGLSLASTTAEWVSVARSNPIDVYTFLIYPGSLTTGFLTEACEALGFELDVREDAAVAGELWTQFVATGRACMYDMFSYVYLMNPLNPAQYGPYWYASYTAKPPGWGYNYAHLMNSTVDSIFANVEFLTDKQESYNEIADILINKEVHSLYESQGTMGMVLNAGFNYTWWAPEIGGPAGPGIAISGIGGSRIKASALPPAIPGVPIGMMLFFMLTSSIGIIYAVQRKRK